MADGLSEGEENTTLSKLFDHAWEEYSSLENCNESSNSETFQKKIKELISAFENLTRMVSSLDTFSSNELLEEVASRDIKYFLLPAVLGDLTQKKRSENRLDILNITEVYFKDFLNRCQNYQLLSDDSNDVLKQNDETRSLPNVISQTQKRDAKIKRYKEKKLLEENIKELKSKILNLSVDDEIVRKYYTTLVKRWINQVYDELDSLEMEKQMLIQIEKRKSNLETETEKTTSPIQKRLTPVIITRNEAQKKVYGLGYPGIPTMSIEEFYEQKLKKQDIDPVEDTSSLMARALAGLNQSEEREKEAIEKEEKDATDDDRILKASRDWDDWKDDHRRGCGNRKNMG